MKTAMCRVQMEDIAAVQKNAHQMSPWPKPTDRALGFLHFSHLHLPHTHTGRFRRGPSTLIPDFGESSGNGRSGDGLASESQRFP